MLDSIFRRGNPSNKWIRSPQLTLNAQLLKPALNGVAIGSQVSGLSFLGRSSTNISSPLEFTDLGLSIDLKDDGSFSGFMLVLEDSSNKYQSYCGTIMLNGSAVAPAKVTRELPEPYWVDRDDEEAILFYEFPSHEIQIEQTLDGISQNIIVTNRPLMARDEQRIAYGVDKPWPPN